jgi:hypothetical protein
MADLSHRIRFRREAIQELDFRRGECERWLGLMSRSSNAGAQQRVRVGILSLTEEFVDIAFAIPKVDASRRIAR